jgi:hypothetical protein
MPDDVQPNDCHQPIARLGLSHPEPSHNPAEKALFDAALKVAPDRLDGLDVESLDGPSPMDFPCPRLDKTVTFREAVERLRRYLGEQGYELFCSRGVWGISDAGTGDAIDIGIDIISRFYEAQLIDRRERLIVEEAAR